MDEMIDTFDANYRHTGVAARAVVHRDGIWHQTFHCWIAGDRGSGGFVLLQLRSPGKKNYPNMLDITAAGHLAAGETPDEGVRELEEELGLRIDSRHLRRLGIKHDIMDETTGVRNREFAHVFLLRDDRKLAQYKLQEDEVSGLVEMPIHDGLQLFAREKESVECLATRVSEGRVTDFVRHVTIVDLIPRVDPYYLKVFIMAERMLSGAQYLSI